MLQCQHFTFLLLWWYSTAKLYCGNIAKSKCVRICNKIRREIELVYFLYSTQWAKIWKKMQFKENAILFALPQRILTYLLRIYRYALKQGRVQVISQTFLNISRLWISCSALSTNQKPRNIQKSQPNRFFKVIFSPFL